MRDERQFAVKDKTQFQFEKEWVAGKERGQAQETTHVDGKSALPTVLEEEK